MLHEVKYPINVAPSAYSVRRSENLSSQDYLEPKYQEFQTSQFGLSRFSNWSKVISVLSSRKNLGKYQNLKLNHRLKTMVIQLLRKYFFLLERMNMKFQTQ